MTHFEDDNEPGKDRSQDHFDSDTQQATMDVQGQSSPTGAKQEHRHSYYQEVDMGHLDGFGAREAKRMARNPCIYLWTSLILAILLSVIAMVVGEFSVSANTGGWQSRGTMIADRQAQLMMTIFNQEGLFYDGDEVWNDLMTNVQSGWEDDDDSRRMLNDFTPAESVASSPVDYLKPKADRIFLSGAPERQIPFELTPDLRRKMQVSLEGCDLSSYTSDSLDEERLWPIWRTKKSSSSALDPDVLRQICEAEENTQNVLKEKGLCYGCEDGCLPPYSVVLYARLTVEDGFSLSCEDLSTAWAPYQANVEEEWKTCVEDIKANFEPNQDTVPESCPDYFSTTMVEEFFEEDMISTYTSSVFATSWKDLDALYDLVDKYDRGGNLVEGSYDTQFEGFNGLFMDDSLTSDMSLAMGSALVVSIAIVIHTRSPFIALMGLLQIMLSFPLSYFIYKLIAGLDFFPFLNFIGIFVVFALGAGDVFVAVDKWKNARLEHPDADTEHVAAVALPDAAHAMALTTVTTAVAFFATAICPVAPIKMFAIFCGLLIVLDYIMNILLVFPALCIYDLALEKKGVDNVSCCMVCTCWGVCKHGEPESEEAVNSRAFEHQDTFDSVKDEEEHSNLIRRLLFAYYKVMHKFRWPLFALCLAGLVISAYVASTLELPTSSDVRLLEEDHEYEQNYLWRQKLLFDALEKAGGSLAYVIWGVKPADTGDQNDPGSFSTLELDGRFDPSSEESQTFLVEFCRDFIAEDFAIPTVQDYKCPMQHFDEWLQEQAVSDSPEEIYTENCDGANGVPVSQENFDACMIAWSKSVDETSVLAYQEKVTILFFPFTSRVRYDDHYDDLDAEWNLIEDWVTDRNRQAPKTVKHGYFSSEDFWWYDTNGQMLATAYSAAGIALGCSAFVILVSSRSVVLTFFSTLTIGYVLTSVTATLVAMDWTLGFLESICFAILIGVSVDFVIHFSHAYASLPGEADRGLRTKFALVTMGPSILATAVTTILSAVVMLFTVITFFQKFALILFFTIIQATVGSFIVFLTMSDCVGPTNPTYLADKYCGGKDNKDEGDKDEGIGATEQPPLGEEDSQQDSA